MKVADCDSTLPHPCLLQRPGSPLCILLGERQLLAVLPDAQVQRLHMLGRPPLLHLRQQTLPLALFFHWSVMYLRRFYQCLTNLVVHLAQQRPHKSDCYIVSPSIQDSRRPLHGSHQLLAILAAVWVQHLTALVLKPLVQPARKCQPPPWRHWPSYIVSVLL